MRRVPRISFINVTWPEKISRQETLDKEDVGTLRIPKGQKDNYEADDVIATLTRRAVAAGMNVLVCTGDRDSLQLVEPGVTVLYPRKGVSDLVRFTPAAVQERYGVTPECYPDLAALVGESSDNLPGVPGVGPKTAAKWITLYGGLEGVLAAAAQIPGKAGESLREHLDQVRLNRELNRAVDDLELPVAVEDLQARPWDREAMHRVFDALEFRTLRERLLAMVSEEQGEAEGFDLEVLTPAPGRLVTWLASRTGRTLALEVSGRAAPGRGDAWALAIADGPNNAVSVDLTEIVPEDEVALAGWLADPDQPKAMHGAKDGWHALDGRGLALRGVVFDTLLASYLCHPDQRSYDLSDLAVRHLQRELRTTGSADDAQGALELDLDGGTAERAAVRAAAVSELTEVLGEALDDRARGTCSTTSSSRWSTSLR